jgi:NAD(P)H-dependent FMN reductase
MADLYAPTILGTARIGRQSEKVAQYMLSQMDKFAGLSTKLIDVRDSGLTASINTSTKTPQALAWRKEADLADGYVIVAPEYNNGYPGELKMFMDQALKEYNKKPVAICGVSSGPFGGVRMVQMLRVISIKWGMVPLSKVAYFPNVENLFNENGLINDKSFDNIVNEMLQELTWMGNALKTARMLR